MFIVKELAWVRPYIQSVAHLIPRLKQLKRISSKKGNRERWQHVHALITYKDVRDYRMTLYTTYHDMPSDSIQEYSTVDLLRRLAHELAHLEHWDHTPDHLHLESVILSTFTARLKQDGYISEEDEEQNGLFFSR